jgi:hypothetical protein
MSGAKGFLIITRFGMHSALILPMAEKKYQAHKDLPHRTLLQNYLRITSLFRSTRGPSGVRGGR